MCNVMDYIGVHLNLTDMRDGQDINVSGDSLQPAAVA
jgi:hypothetical protein